MERNRAILRFALTGFVAAFLAGPAPSWGQVPATEAGAKASALPAELLRGRQSVEKGPAKAGLFRMYKI